MLMMRSLCGAQLYPQNRLMLMMRGRFGLESWTTQRLADADVAWPVWARNLNQRWADAHDAQPLRAQLYPEAV